jgi:hypothetical protein
MFIGKKNGKVGQVVARARIVDNGTSKRKARLDGDTHTTAVARRR